MKANKESHVMNTKFGMGDYYGVGIKNKIGKIRDFGSEVPLNTNKKFGIPPKSLA